ncbi:hypothetical protein GEMRC1_014003 [Eukaryota sp. GEM-RC1]
MSFYGQPLPVTTQTFPHLSLIADFLQYQQLSDFVTERMSEGLSNFDHNDFPNDLDLFVFEIVDSCPRDVRVSYKNTSIKINSVILSLFSKTYFTLFSCQFEDSNTRVFSYCDQFPGVNEDVFSQFFDLFYCKSIEFSILNVLDYFQLSDYFQVDELKLACQKFLVNTFSEAEVICLLKDSNERNQLHFITENLQLFSVLSKNY